MQSTRPIKWLLGFGYLLFGVAAFLVFLYMTFPFNLIQEKVIRIAEAESGCQITAGSQSTAPPLRMKWEQVLLLCPTGLPMMIASIETDIAILPLVLHRQGQVDVRVQMPEEGSQITGSITASTTPAGYAFLLKGEGTGLRLDPVGIPGSLDHIKGEATWIGENPLAGVGSLAVSLSDIHIDPVASPIPLGNLGMITTIAGVKDISISTLQGEVAWQSNTLSIKMFNAQGEIADIISDGGSFTLHEPVSESIVSMTLAIIPKGNLKQMVPLMISHYVDREPLTAVITGPLSAPDIVINGMKMPVS
jgi:type II secretion system protein N